MHMYFWSDGPWDFDCIPNLFWLPKSEIRLNSRLGLFATLQAKTKIKLGATAGLRLLPEGKADLILDAVKEYFQQTPFILDPETGVSILDGTHCQICFLTLIQIPILHASATSDAMSTFATDW